MVERASRNYAVYITTSGVRVTEDQLNRIKHRAVLVFGLDGIGDTHDFYRRRPGAFEDLMKVLTLAHEFPKEIIVTLWKGVLQEIEEILNLGKTYGVIVHFNGIIPVGRATGHTEILPDSDELNAVNKRIERLQREGEPVVTDLHVVTEKDRRSGIPLFCRGRYNITPGGDVRPCEFHSTVFGNIHKRPLRDIIEDANKTDFIKAREKGFKEQLRDDLQNPFDYHTEICQRIRSVGCSKIGSQ
jgi:MoaA/NifB/PqqE/SkfB family radical SAM enzyme